ncbi:MULTISPECIES: ribonuclease E inhibitor RraB [unclassified Novosphingobium]|uniref:ribonuclease E inhibitor RraB n=1 Tax=unclassified Novosphingobium TaxID=2644732 RepID=UPI000F5F2B84|nr:MULTISPECIES: ribonuclease E inhibitor RraB [unclassified Novosphingobium]MBF5089684.1 ribonuclease E inhibitor RraB [Novosphingobium sp. NBM11]RQW39799.1 ribonuclease E inhibitor RraB [Novosphingobium sp. LASN5T]
MVGAAVIDAVADVEIRWQSHVVTLFDENAEVLRGMRDRGVDLDVERTVDFSHIFPTERDAHNFIQACSKAGFAAVKTTVADMDDFDVTVSKAMTPSCVQISETEDLLGKLASRHNGRADGWGFWSN